MARTAEAIMPDENTPPDGRTDPQLTSPHVAPRTDSDTGIAPERTIVQTAPPSLAPPPRSAPVRHVPGFDILGELGRGGMGVVYKARQHGLGRVVALKMVLHGAHATAEELDRFRAEAEAIARLRHPNIVEVYAYGETEDGLPYFALEFCEGGTLAALCARPLPLHRAAELVVALARAVHAAHAAGIVHRDLKPGNILLQAESPNVESRNVEDGGSGASDFTTLRLCDLRPKVTDFGLAKGLGQAQGRTQTGAVLGTPAYMAPEQAAGRSTEIGPAADVYALGAILYHLLTGRPPFDGAGGVPQTLLAVQHDEPTRPRGARPAPRRPRPTCGAGPVACGRGRGSCAGAPTPARRGATAPGRPPGRTRTRTGRRAPSPSP
ncbi:MAG: serine/threonine protein kinase [Planctomycetes bacterium]|nr:serine/threonine protein kinase [Planctomycetota bacterium]